jgi:diguanylate cyclase (GGDEF)-like protein
LGGDEFLVFLSGLQGEEDARRAAEKIRAAVAEPFWLEGQQLHVTASIGVSRAREGDSTDALILDADEAMYAAKRAGGNRVSEAPGA